MSSGSIGTVWATALLDAARGTDEADAWGSQLAFVARLLEADRSFAAFWNTPGIAASSKKTLVRKVFAEFPEPVRNFLCLLLDKKRHRYLPEILERYRALADERAGRMTASCQSAAEIPSAAAERLARALSKTFGKQATLARSVSPDLLGGIRVQVGDWVLDGTVKHRLKQIRQTLLAERT
jgi:F-type H+-transporting ATPase subunit delta